VKKGIEFVLSMLNPASAVVKAVMIIYDFIMFLKNNWERIVSFAQTVYNTVADIAAGNLFPGCGRLLRRFKHLIKEP
jgi:hypothetical protein